MGTTFPSKGQNLKLSKFGCHSESQTQSADTISPERVRVCPRTGKLPERKSHFRSGPLAQKLNFNPNCTLRGLLALPKLPKLPEPTVKDALPKLPRE